MAPRYHNPRWAAFAASPHVSAGPIGRIPRRWVATHSLTGIPTATLPLPEHLLDRATVRAICLNPANPVLFGYVCAMAWGSQGAGPGGPRHVVAAWRARAKIVAHLTAVRSGSLDRCAAYNLFLGVGAVPGLGPSYFTKLLYFFSPQPDFYIMDQWTGKSVDLLAGALVVRMTGHDLSNLNKCGNYQAYCEEVDAMAGLLGVTGEQAEEMLMSKGGHNPWPWRAHVRKAWGVWAPGRRYSVNAISAKYPHIPENFF